MRYRTRVTGPAAALVGTAVVVAGGGAAHAAPAGDGKDTAATPAPETLGDPVFPALGNDGYRVTDYDLDLSCDATTTLVEATATLDIRTTRCLSRFSLDVSGFLRDWLYGTTTPRMPGHPDWTVTPVTPSLTAPHNRSRARWHENSATL
ncbi:hypothetical protein [Streptomyces sp. T028]|uniref:hypothetical protein n=1 Tax=Streptomyces sp. T028 TaxID=3394379 RepID=UPI003A8BED79